MSPSPPASQARSGSPPRRLAGLLVLLLVLPVVIVGSSCSEAADEQAVPAAELAAAAGADLATPPPLQPDDLVDLTVYYRAGEGPAAHLEPVVAEVPVSDDLPRRALELLLGGPGPEHGSLEPPLPTSTEVVDLVIEGGTAHVELSREVLDDAASVGASPANEALALAALANTLTEFTSVERVVLAVAGEDEESAEAFWGGWGLPDVLVRDESLVGTGEGEGPVDLGRFSDAAQEAGSPGVPPVRVTGIRVRDRITHTRLIIELAAAGDDEVAAKVPPVSVRRAGGRITLVLEGVIAVEGEAPGPLEVDPARLRSATSQLDESSGRLRVLLEPVERLDYWLHTLSNPARVVLDLRK